MEGANREHKPLKVLIIEDSADDAELLVLELRRAGYDPHFEVTDSAAPLCVALDQNDWDVVLCDYTMAALTPA
jgi:CheY-like chemotaxis protein